jgi:hypothetical protein
VGFTTNWFGHRPGYFQGNEWARSMAGEIHEFIGQKLTVLVEAFNRGYQGKELLSHFQQESAKQVEAILAGWDSLCEEAKEIAGHLELKDGHVSGDMLMVKVEEALDLNKRLMVLCAERYKKALEDL